MTMAADYVRIWLALQELYQKDPSPEVVRAVQAISVKLSTEVEDDYRLGALVNMAGGVGSPEDHAVGYPWDQGDMMRTRTPQESTSRYQQMHPNRQNLSNVMTPMTPFNPPTPASAMGGIGSVGRLDPNGAISPRVHLGDNPMNTPMSSMGTGYRPQYGAGSATGGGGMTTPSERTITGGWGPSNPRGALEPPIGSVETLDSHDPITQAIRQEPALASYFYEWHRKQFLAPDLGYAPEEDPLSVEGRSKMFREGELRRFAAARQEIRRMYGGLDDANETVQSSNRDDLQVYRTNPLSTLPHTVTKFEEKALINIENANMTSLVLFHSFQNILAVTDGRGVGIWSLKDSSRILYINNRSPLTNPASSAIPVRSAAIRTGTQAVPMPYTPSPGQFGRVGVDNEFGTPLDQRNATGLEAPLSAASPRRVHTQQFTYPQPTHTSRITSIAWVNESLDSLMLVGSDDGAVRVWKDISDTDTAPMPPTSSIINGSYESSSGASAGPAATSNSSLQTSPGISLATAFIALPDMPDTSRGSGMVTSWLQQTGTLVVGGNSKTIRLWDLQREQCVRTYTTGLNTCTTCLASKAVTSTSMSYPIPPSIRNVVKDNNPEEDMPISWTFAGFADGTLGVFDPRVSSNGGRVHISREHDAWIVSAYIRSDVPEVITASVRGLVKFSDIRTMRCLKTLEVQSLRSPLTAMAVHQSAPILASGSHTQFIKILTFGGDQLGSLIKYHDGFMGQRIGPVSCLAFHPSKMLLAAGATTDSIVSIWGTAGS
jgi:WD40 repeat protein